MLSSGNVGSVGPPHQRFHDPIEVSGCAGSSTRPSVGANPEAYGPFVNVYHVMPSLLTETLAGSENIVDVTVADEGFPFSQ